MVMRRTRATPRLARDARHIRSGGSTQDDKARRILFLVAAARRVSVRELLRPTRSAAATALARQIAMYLLHVGLGANLTETARVFSRDRTTAAHACSRIEARRDDTTFDIQIRCLEEAMRLLCAPLEKLELHGRETV